MRHQRLSLPWITFAPPWGAGIHDVTTSASTSWWFPLLRSSHP